MSKYHSTKVVYDGITFDSKIEAMRWIQLKDMENHGDICELKRQVEYVLLPKSKAFPRGCRYVADFVYVNADGEAIVEDVKGFRTKEYEVKKKWLYGQYGILVTEFPERRKRGRTAKRVRKAPSKHA